MVAMVVSKMQTKRDNNGRYISRYNAVIKMLENSVLQGSILNNTY